MALAQAGAPTAGDLDQGSRQAVLSGGAAAAQDGSVVSVGAPSGSAPPKVKKRARFADDDEAAWRYKDGTRVAEPVTQHSQVLQALQQTRREAEVAEVRGMPARIEKALAQVYVSLHERQPPDEEASAALLRGMFTDGAKTGDVKFPPVLYAALFAYFKEIFGMPPGSAEELNGLAKRILRDHEERVRKIRAASSLARFATKGEITARAFTSREVGETSRNLDDFAATSKGGTASGSLGKSVESGAHAPGCKPKSEGLAYFEIESALVRASAAASSGFGARDRRKADRLVKKVTDQEKDATRRELEIVHYFIDYTYVIFAMALGSTMLLGLSAGSHWASGDPEAQLSPPANFRLDDTLTQWGHAAVLAEDFALAQPRVYGNDGGSREAQGEVWHSLDLMYTASLHRQTFDLLQPDAVARMRQIEQEIVALPGYNDYCYRPKGSNACERPLSFTALAYNQVSLDDTDLAAFSLPRGAELVHAVSTCAPEFTDCLRPHLLPTWCKRSACSSGLGIESEAEIAACIDVRDVTSLDATANEWLASAAGRACAEMGTCKQHVERGCIARELFALARAHVSSHTGLNDLAQPPRCGWSPNKAFIGHTTVSAVGTFLDGMRSPDRSTPQPLNATAHLAATLLPTRTYSPVVNHFFDRVFSRAARGEEPDPSVRGRWSAWSRGQCAAGNGYRIYTADLLGLSKPSAAACYHYSNRPFLLARVRAVANCETIVAWPCALFLYRYVLDFKHVEEFTLLASPVTAAFSFDAMTLLIDAWQLSSSQSAAILSSLPARLNWVFNEAGFACTHSIIVAMCAFVACSYSSWLQISHFGVFCAVQLLVQLFMALIFLPVGLVIFHDQLEMKPNLAFFCCQGKPAEGEKAVTAYAAFASLWTPQPLTSTEHLSDTRALEASIGKEPEPPKNVHGSWLWPFPRLLTRIFVPVLYKPAARCFFLVFFVSLFGFVLFLVGGAKSDSQQRGRLIDTHPLVANQQMMDQFFDVSSLDKTVRVTFLWGSDGVDQAGVNLMRDSSYVGKIRWRDGFRFDAASQAHLAAACDVLREQSWLQLSVGATARGRLLEKASVADERVVHCFVDDFRLWLANSNASRPFGRSFPIPDALNPTRALHTIINSPVGFKWRPYVAATPERIFSVAISADMMLRESAKRLEAEANAAVVLNWTHHLNALAPTSAGHALPSTESLWAWMRAQAALPSEALFGCLRTAAMSSLALLVVTSNLQLTVITGFVVFAATLTLLALLVVSGAALGSTEAVLACIAPALLTPPAAFVLRAYANSPEGSRVDRSANAYAHGSSIVSSSWFAIAVVMAPVLSAQLSQEFKVSAALIFVSLCVFLPQPHRAPRLQTKDRISQ
ncbi:hypothetical protein Ctob_000519 [Chrysochromulina tobinii]|uniref:SSD domain-containing protein n=1 Tax=Chrysochromulina tobinii TaxID=1460289 RepID=A0A0M0J7H9_9EUKA|nr:hypothetical protein Ctob_000519 [Chrysochromulina tobinii]|eukprot:KOO22425.1 hypothetical protein Ctob_000519 [Chrysochromulina sp. CCMP291]